MTSRRQRVAVAAAVLVALACAIVSTELGTGLLFLAPGLVLLLPLLLSRYVGERSLARLRGIARRPRPRRPTDARVPRQARRASGPVVRGSALVGDRLARRPPPRIGLASAPR
jgi:hypothetical protein